MDFKSQKLFVYRTLFLAFFGAVIIACQIHILFYAFEIEKTPSSSLSICYVYISIYRVLYVVQFYYACSSVRVRFKAVNRLLNNFSESAVSVNNKFMRSFLGLCDAIDIINETFTFQITLLFMSLLVRKIIFSINLIESFEFGFEFSSIFASFGIVNELLQRTDHTSASLLLNGLSLIGYGILIMITLNSGSSLTKEARATITVISKHEASGIKSAKESHKIDFIFFVTQMRSRNLQIQNDFFKINWNVLLAVS